MRWAHGRGHGPDPHRDHAAGRDRRATAPTSICRCRVLRAQLERAASRSTTSPTRPAARPATSRVAETGGRLGFITPLTHNFCESCNRVRLTCTGTLYMCLGQEDAADLRAPLRASEGDDLLAAAIDEAIARKPKGHDFVIDRRTKRPAVVAPHERHRRLSPRCRFTVPLIHHREVYRTWRADMPCLLCPGRRGRVRRSRRPRRSRSAAPTPSPAPISTARPIRATARSR